MAITFTQSRSTWPTTSAASTALAYSSGNAAGGLLIAFVAWNSVTVTCSLADSKGNTWQALGGPAAGAGTLAGFRIQLFCAPNAAAGANTVTATFSGAVTRRGIAIHEYAGCDTSATPNDVSAAYNNHNSAAPTSSSIATSTAATLIFSGCLSQVAVTGGGSHGEVIRENTNFGSNATEDRTVSATGSYTADYVATAGDNALVVCAFKAAPPAPSAAGFAVSNAAGGNSLSGVFPSAVAVGDLVVVASSRDTATGATTNDTCSDSLGNTYTRLDVANDATSQQGLAWFYSVIGHAGTPTITASYPSTSLFRALLAQAFTGLNQAALDQKTVVATPSTSGAGTDNAVTAAITPSVNGCLLVGVINVTHNVSAVDAGTGYTEEQDTGTSVTELQMIAAVQGAAASVTGKWTISGGAGALYTAVLASFLPDSGTLPVNTAAPTISGSAFVGQTLTKTSDGTWTNTPTGYLYQWQRDDQSVTPPASGMRDASLATWNSLLPTGLSTVVVTTAAGFASALTNLPSSGGTLIDVTTPIAVTNVDIRRKFTGVNAIRFCAGCTATNTCHLEAANLYLYGLTIQNTSFVNGSYSGSGLEFTNCTNVRWWGVLIHDLAAHGMFAHGNGGPNTGLDIDAEVYHCGLDLSRDPHSEKGTGLHPAYIGSLDVSNAGTQGKFSITAHDCDTGSIQLGNAIHDSELWIDARRLNKVAVSQVAGNAMQWWSKSGFPNLTNITVHFCYGEDLAGRMSEISGLPTGQASNVIVEVGRHAGSVRLSPLYLPASGITYLDCT